MEKLRTDRTTTRSDVVRFEVGKHLLMGLTGSFSMPEFATALGIKPEELDALLAAGKVGGEAVILRHRKGPTDDNLTSDQRERALLEELHRLGDA